MSFREPYILIAGLEVIDWDEFKKILKERNLQVYESGGWMKIMKK